MTMYVFYLTLKTLKFPKAATFMPENVLSSCAERCSYVLQHNFSPQNSAYEEYFMTCQFLWIMFGIYCYITLFLSKSLLNEKHLKRLFIFSIVIIFCVWMVIFLLFFWCIFHYGGGGCSTGHNRNVAPPPKKCPL